MLPFARQPVNLTLLVSLVLDPRWHQRPIYLPTVLEYHNDLPLLLWPSYLLSAILKPAIYEHDTALYRCIPSYQ
ncbi:hypothetical protein GQ44DRAFT_709642 [Phaeosphaeriaceae sp. PMI808]|nr:hypothetical protein GQ44DRAFT_709642 [Phaeosphaeriaceae sp. PMI808]